MPVRPALVLACALLAGIAADARAERADPATPPETAMTADDDPTTGAELLAADRAFAAAVAAARGADRARAWAEWFAPEGRQLVPGAVVTGRASILGLMAPAFGDTAYSLAWEPDLAAGAGAWGWTSGRYASTRPGPDGPVRREGRYLTVWQRQRDGSWKVAVDTGVPDGE